MSKEICQNCKGTGEIEICDTCGNTGYKVSVSFLVGEYNAMNYEKCDNPNCVTKTIVTN